MMIRRYGLFLLTLPVGAVFSAAPAVAQYYSPPPPGYIRSAPPPGAYYDDRLPPPAFWNDDDDDDQPARRPYRSPQLSQVPPGQAGAPNRILPYPDEADAPPPPPGFAPPPGRPPFSGHQLDQQMPPAANRDPDEVRPPGAIGAAPSATPQPAPPGATAALPPEDQPEQGKPKELAPNLKKQLVSLSTKEPAGTIIIDTPNTYLYLVLGDGKALRYGIGVGREGFTWAGTERISKMKDWPDWFPPSEMIERQPYLPRMMAGGPGNPLGARALPRAHAVPHPRHQPALDHRYVRVVRLHPAAQRRHRGPVQPRSGRHACRRHARQGAGDGGK